MKSPCYNVETKTDCPDRKCGCQVDCPKWAEYVKAREEMYERRAKDRIIGEITYASMENRKIKHAKEIAHRDRRGRKK